MSFISEQAATFTSSVPGAHIGISGCCVQSGVTNIAHTYSPVVSNTTLSRTITVTGSNLISSASAAFSYYLDTFVTNLTISCLVSPAFAFTNNSLPFRVSGTWGNNIHLTIQRQDGLVLVNQSFAFQPYYDFNFTFNASGMYQLTVIGSNYVNQVQFTMPTQITIATLFVDGCTTPEVDITVPNSCYPAVSCDPQYPSVEALMVMRSALWTIYSNVTTGECPRGVSRSSDYKMLYACTRI